MIPVGSSACKQFRCVAETQVLFRLVRLKLWARIVAVVGTVGCRLKAGSYMTHCSVLAKLKAGSLQLVWAKCVTEQAVFIL